MKRERVRGEDGPQVMLDCGATQQDALSVDRVGSLQNYFHTAVKPRETLLATEAEWLQASCVQVVVSDIVPLACAAAAKVPFRPTRGRPTQPC